MGDQASLSHGKNEVFVTYYRLIIVICCIVALVEGNAYAQNECEDYDDFDQDFADEEDEPAPRVYGSVKVQASVFVPLISDITQRPKDKAYANPNAEVLQECDPVKQPYNGCTPVDHAME